MAINVMALAPATHRFNQVDVVIDAAFALSCPNCKGHYLDHPRCPRGDDAVECRTCHEWFTFAELEGLVLRETRKLLARAFPRLPLSATDTRESAPLTSPSSRAASDRIRS
ncbi:MAG: hypothetical protein ABI843_03445 [Dokdonella sp.]